METKRSKVTAVALKKEGQGQKGVYYIFTIIFENGDNGDYITNTNPQTYFKQGTEVDYVKEVKVNGQYTNTSIKPPQSANGRGGYNMNPALQNKRIALQSACTLLSNDPDSSAKAVTDLASLFETWLNGGEQKQGNQATTQSTPGSNYDDDSLPF